MRDPERIREYCLNKAGVTEDDPFGPDVIVYKVMNKIFLFMSLNEPVFFSVKNDPETIVELREKYSDVTPGYHLNKKHWNSVAIQNTIPDDEIREWIDRSYELIAASLKKSDRETLNKMNGKHAED